jgi:hypothetical protein
LYASVPSLTAVSTNNHIDAAVVEALAAVPPTSIVDVVGASSREVVPSALLAARLSSIGNIAVATKFNAVVVLILS